MSEYKEQLDAVIKSAFDRGDQDDIAVRRVFFFDSPKILTKYSEAGFQIIDEVSRHYSVPFKGIYIAGSAQTGYSYIKARDFILKDSDLDLAIVDASLFQVYFEIAYQETDGYTDLTKFHSRKIPNPANSFRNYLCKGYFRPDLMPNCPAKQDWFGFFNELSNKHSDVFDNINCGIYLSEKYFEHKQRPVIIKCQEGFK